MTYAAMRNFCNQRFIGIAVIAALVMALLLVDDLGLSWRSAMLVAMLGPVGALWMFRLLCLIFIGLALWAIWQDVKSQTRVDRIIAQRNMIEKDVRRDE
ncbi:UNVERIFIED_ORG: branched-subunit amino acid transport protein [Rhizobium pisi]